MPKRKARPIKLTAHQRRDENFRFGSVRGSLGGAGPSSALDDSDTDSEKKTVPLKKNKTSIEEEVVEGLADLLSDSELYVSITRSLKADDFFLLGHVTFKVHDHHCMNENELLPAKGHDFWLYVSGIPERSMIYFEWLEKEGTFKRVKIYTLEDTLDCNLFRGSSKCISLSLDNFNTETKELKISINLRKTAITDKHDDKCYEKGTQVSVQHIMKLLYNISIPDLNDTGSSNHSEDDIDDLYTAVKSYHETVNSPETIDVQHPSLLVKLRQYQRSAVQWMLQREQLLHAPQNIQLHHLYKEISTKDNQVLYYNFYLGNFVYEKPICKPPTPGGILADEMGLGKTVEVLSCILANPRTDLAFVKIEKPVESSRKRISSKVGNCSDDDDSEKLPDAENTENSQNIEDASKSENMEVDNNAVVKFEAVAGPSSANDGFKMTKRKRRVTFSETPVITYADYLFDSADSDDSDDSSDVSWSENLRFGDHVKPKKKQNAIKEQKPKSALTAKTTKSGCNVKLKSILKNTVQNKETMIEKSASKSVSQQLSSARKQAAKELYEAQLAEYSAVEALYDSNRKKRHSGYFDLTVSRKSLFECVCGVAGEEDPEEDVKCSHCGVWQHPGCVQFDKNLGQKYFCPHCWQLQPKVMSRATLIVAPASISQQWMDEIHKLIKLQGLGVTFYKGVYLEGFIQPQSLADVDIVITTYETLRKEIDYVDLPHCNAVEGRKLRNAKRYMALPSSLPCVQWWRVCLDEAQMVESVSTKTAEMALRLAAVHRWCISGTPIQSSIEDLFGLVMFLGVDPYCHEVWWSTLLQQSYRSGNHNEMYSLICPLMWRTSKDSVLDQIGIPAQTEQIHWINFCPVEEHFYRRQHAQCANVVLNQIAQLPNLNDKLHKLHKDVLSGLMSALLTLRQACCHPQTVKGQFISVNKTTLTMGELLESMIKKSRIECEESFRQVVSALNGLAGIHVIQEEWLNAVERYREVLMLVEVNKEKMKADRLQRIHTLHNLAELLELQAKNTNIPRTLRDSNLKQEAEELETDYLNKCIAAMKTAQQAVEPLSNAVSKLQDQLKLSDAWWSLTLRWADGQKEDQEVVERVRQSLIGGKKKNRASAYNKVYGLESMLLESTDSLDELREKLLTKMRKLETEGIQSLVNEAVECHLRTLPNVEGASTAKLCKLCQTSDLFEEYEKLLFREEETKVGHELVENVKVFGKLNRITWADGETEKILKAVLAYAKIKKVDACWISDGNTQIKIFDAQKKEFKYLRTYWRQLNDHVSAADELNMCKLRLRLRYPHEPSIIKKQNPKQPGKQPLKNLSSNLENKVENIYIIEAHEVESYALSLTTERSNAQGDLRRRMGQLQYLENLQKSGVGHSGAPNPELCPICRISLGVKWCVLLCGHCYCVGCLAEFKKHQHNKRQVCCPVCREITSLGEISYVNTMMQKDSESSSKTDENTLDLLSLEATSDFEQDETPQVLARNSAKAEAVVQVLKTILMEDLNAKALVFSTWPDMLLVLARALRENDISYAHMESGKKFLAALNLFKDPTKKVSALLLPVHSGANGLNLTEATHVLLVEPILNTASELQALGRVHRIGQTKPTVVHRFIVKGTIEERMHEVLRSRQKKTVLDHDPVTVRDIRDMFTSSSDNPTSSSLQEEEEAMDVVYGPSSSTA